MSGSEGQQKVKTFTLALADLAIVLQQTSTVARNATLFVGNFVGSLVDGVPNNVISRLRETAQEMQQIHNNAAATTKVLQDLRDRIAAASTEPLDVTAGIISPPAIEAAVEQISRFDALLKEIGLKTGPELAKMGLQVGEAFSLAAEALRAGDITPERFQGIATSLDEMAKKIIEEGGIVPGFVAVNEEVKKLGTQFYTVEAAVQFLIDNGVEKLNEAIAAGAIVVEQTGAAMQRLGREVGVNVALQLGDAFVDAMSQADFSLRQFLKNLVIGIAKAIIQMQILAAIARSISGGGGGGSGGAKGFAGSLFGGLLTGDFAGVAKFFFGAAAGAGGGGKSGGGGFGVPLEPGRIGFAQGGIVPGHDTGRDKVPALLQPGEAVLPRRLVNALLSGGGGTQIVVGIRNSGSAVLKRLAEELTFEVRRGSLQLEASALASPRTSR
jgi:hypothetical protein